ncbi:hypothetical protein Psi01_04390 [Planobispora siamensis]|uniref:Uncharacterized protein n=1 Tax=Planobispora siamensis TaxID=936338 RepID=A0A8J3WGV3_9ACTN|nr:hypothetical protein Psi01_04390 [Planobispora siamensis]
MSCEAGGAPAESSEDSSTSGDFPAGGTEGGAAGGIRGTRTVSSPSPMGNRRGTRGVIIAPSSEGMAGMGAVGASYEGTYLS